MPDIDSGGNSAPGAHGVFSDVTVVSPNGPYVPVASLPAGGASFAGGRWEVQSAEGVAVPIWMITPFTASTAPFQARYQSFANAGGGAGTFNHGAFLGFNVGIADGGASMSNVAGWVMGFEDNYFDATDSTYGTEWYIEYESPDHSSVQLMRPFYCRIKGSNLNTSNNSVIHMDIGTDTTGSLTVFAGTSNPPLLTLTAGAAGLLPPLVLTATTLQLHPAAGQAQFSINSPTAPTIKYLISNAQCWLVQALTVNSFLFYDKNSRVHLTLTQGTTAAAALSEFSSSVQVDGSIGFYGTTPAVKPTVTGAKGSNAALASLLTALASQGLLTDSSTA
jgi:hypothetical protein